MKSTGNDIVALELVDKERTNQFRFYSKILSASEQELYHQPHLKEITFGHYVWLLWSVKESAYKYFKRLHPGLIFSPTKIIIQQIELPDNFDQLVLGNKPNGICSEVKCYRGEVTYNGHALYFRSVVSEEWIASVVNIDEDFNDVCWGVEKIDNTDSESRSVGARMLLLKGLAPHVAGALRIEKSPVGYPVIVNDGDVTGTIASLAHDGHFVSYSYLLDTVPIAGLLGV